MSFEVTRALAEFRIVPVVVLDRVEDATPLAIALETCRK